MGKGDYLDEVTSRGCKNGQLRGDRGKEEGM